MSGFWKNVAIGSCTATLVAAPLVTYYEGELSRKEEELDKDIDVHTASRADNRALALTITAGAGGAIGGVVGCCFGTGAGIKAAAVVGVVGGAAGAFIASPLTTSKKLSSLAQTAIVLGAETAGAALALAGGLAWNAAKKRWGNGQDGTGYDAMDRDGAAAPLPANNP